MKLTVEIPDPKFKIGDFVRYTRSASGAGMDITVQIVDVAATWRVDWDQRSGAAVRSGEATYVEAVQEGSAGASGAVIRPGTCFVSPVPDLDEWGEAVDYQGRVWEVDRRDEQIVSRLRNWDQVAGKDRADPEERKP